MFGTIVFENPSTFYAEYLVADENGVRVVACLTEGSVKMYRIEWPDNNTAVYCLFDAIALFTEKQLEAAERAADAQEQSAEPLIVFVEGSMTHFAANNYQCDEPECICRL